jgi:hypothetical protein
MAAAVAHACSGTLPKAPSPCPACNVSGRLAFVPFLLEAEQLLRYHLPPNPPAEAEVREEPWVFQLTVGFNGRPCGVRLVKGETDGFASAFAEALSSWEFTPRVVQGIVVCSQARVFVYVHRVDGQPEVIVPGVTDRESTGPRGPR